MRVAQQAEEQKLLFRPALSFFNSGINTPLSSLAEKSSVGEKNREKKE